MERAPTAAESLTAAHEYDEGTWMTNNWLSGRLWGLAMWVTTDPGFPRATSMHVTNDPRFFAGNVMDKRLAAMKMLTLVSSIMFSTSLGQCFALKKNMDFSDVKVGVFDLAIWQIVAFCLALLVSIQCLLSLYIIAMQLFFTYRLMTAGTLGFDIAAVFYLTRTITMWRHLAIKALFNGLMKFLILVGIQMFVTFYRDADKLQAGKHDTEMIVNLQNGTSQNWDVVKVAHATHKLSMKVHVAIGYTVLAICISVACVMYKIKSHHYQVFKENYEHCEESTMPIQKAFRTMGTRAGGMIET
jgi:hypothetical protein